MIRIITKRRLDRLEDIEFKWKSLYTRVDQLYWLSSFTFMNNLITWIKSGISGSGNQSIDRVRSDFEKDVDDFYNNTLSSIQNENIELVNENRELRLALKVLSKITTEDGE